ncbi:MAG: sigma-70 family RNA polymerase sigma factor [Amphiplicatus sp.]|nr:sigma-70 family RNA polymerase sigma factor [Amphiplicatus sp.]MCB9956439.1 sigma-70 family RNA polymerase sigma factor [Caulobacterales bacterium]HRX38681.1 sigma-70 family RNA polymerase sigma factor [Parvularculaceae bacterium]
MTTTFTADELNEVLPALRRFALSLTRNPDRADDLVQDSVERALLKASYYRPGTNLRSWLFTLCRRLFLNDIRKQKSRGVSVELDDVSPSAISVKADQHSHLEFKEAAGIFRTMADDDREVISLVALDGLKYEDAARKLRVPIGTVRSRLSRARARLRSRMDGGFDGAPAFA